MNILMLTGSYPPELGGISSFVQGLASGLTSQGAVIRVLSAIPGSSRFSSSDIPVSEFTLPSGGYLRRVAACRRAVRHAREQFPFDRIIASSWSPYAVGLPSLTSATTDVLYHGMDLLEPARSQRYRWIMRRTARRVSHLIANSIFTANAAGQLTRQPGKVVVLNPGIDTEAFAPGPPNEAVLRKRGIQPGARIILSVGRLVERKGFDSVITALPALLGEFPQAIYVIVGEGDDRHRLETIARTHGVTERVVFTGEVDDEELLAFYCSSDVFAMPSRHLERDGDVEGFGIVFLEAASCGLPTIGGRSGGIEDAIVDGETGYLVDPLSSLEIASRIGLLLRDPGLRQRLGDAGRKRAVERFSWSAVAERYLRGVCAG